MRAKRVIAAAAAIEVLTACLLVVAPAVFARLLLGAELSGAGAALGRLAGISLLALALACWPRGTLPRQAAQPVLALLIFSVLCSLFLAYLGIGGENAGVLLWPAVATHAAMAGLLIWSSLAERHR
ncbi:hypothetical protein [Neoroseomonas soli]|uniref:Transmembrane protein n=1 Tax=Neoroseomonas soli TaxID=1081025 RepID=A0A9X9WZ34_9PROT|nr:hypothetical protein [Neoroseomonas soli]MBR0672413.1 hypothetical protein [Neoroseomonas soli]